MTIRSYHESHYGTRTYWTANRHGKIKANTDAPTGTLFFGVELEGERGARITPDTFAAHVDALVNTDAGRRMNFERDGSLDDGVELISEPMTLAAHLAPGTWDAIAQQAEHDGMKSHDTRTCGLHVHVTRDALASYPHTGDADADKRIHDERVDMVCAKLLVLLGRFRPELEKLGRRTWGHYCAPNETDLRGIASTGALLRAFTPEKTTNHAMRYHALNLTNTATVEFRFFKGTYRAETLYATLELVDALVRYCMTHTTPDVQTCTLADVLTAREYKYLPAYAASRLAATADAAAD